MDQTGFQKIDILNKKDDNSAATSEKTPMRKKRRTFSNLLRSKAFRIIAAVLLLFIVVGAYTGLKANAVYKQAKATNAQARIAYDKLKEQNIEVAQAELEKTKTELTKLQDEMGGLFYLGYVPGVHWYYNDANHGVNAAVHGVNAALITTETLIPYADVLGLKGEGTFVGGSAQDRIRLAVKTLGKVVPRIDDIDGELIKAQEEINQMDPKHYPNMWKFAKVRETIASAQEITTQGVDFVRDGKPLIKILPELLGEKESKKYLILFQNDKELRPTGGFITFYALFRVEEGVLTVDGASDIYDLDNSIASHPPAPEIIDKYLPQVNRLYIRDANLSPDFSVSMEEFLKLYEEGNAAKDIDGIIALDTHFFVNALNVIGEVQAGGFTFNTDNDPRCDCPQAVYILEDQTTRPVGFVRENRKSLLADLMQALMQKALASSPREYWGPLFQQSLQDMQNKHIVLYMFDDEAQKGVEALNWGGRIKDFDGDYVHINDANFGGAKSNMYVTKDVRIDYNGKAGEEINKTVTINYKNPHPHSDCNLESGGLCLNATLRNFQRMYVPEGSQLKNSEGSEVTVETKEGLGKSYFEGFFTVAPLGGRKMVYEYTLPFKVENGSTLPVLIQKQPGIAGDKYEVYANGKKVEEFDLVSDKQFEIKL